MKHIITILLLFLSINVFGQIVAPSYTNMTDCEYRERYYKAKDNDFNDFDYFPYPEKIIVGDFVYEGVLIDIERGFVNYYLSNESDFSIDILRDRNEIPRAIKSKIWNDYQNCFIEIKGGQRTDVPIQIWDYKRQSEYAKKIQSERINILSKLNQ